PSPDPDPDTPTTTGGDTDPPPDDDLAYEDPRGGLFADFQAGFDRSHPFQPIDAFCRPHDPAENREATDPGITADSIEIVQIRSQLEDFEGIGFGIPVGDPTAMWTAFADFVNEECGGVRGRMINMTHIDVAVLGAEVDAQRRTACVEATEDRNAVIVTNSTGFQGTAVLCIVEGAETIFITTQGVPREYYDRSGGRLITVSPTLEESLQYLGDELLATGELEGKTIGVVAPDTPGQDEPVEAFAARLQSEGLSVPVVSIIGCAGGTTCDIGVLDSVGDMLDAGIDVMFNTLNVVSLPGYVNEMVTQGFEPGEVQFYQSDFNSHAGDLVESKVVQFGGEAAGELYNGSIIIDDANTGFVNDPTQSPYTFNEMCNDTYQAMGGEVHTAYDEGTSGYGMASGVCAQLRIGLRAIYDAGDNPTRADIETALVNLGPVDLPDGLPASIAPGKPSMPDATHRMVFNYPCPGIAFDELNTCITNAENDEYRLVNQ
ncbi:MAG: ABC transporter substrate-binding protein, partial [Acidimicrobiales bacterium]|nr:ABC transporter substrate-binding protein [Acidimicrobiales bacterium]